MKNSFFTHPSIKTMILLSVLWLVSIVLSVLADTDLFQDSFFKQKYLGTQIGMLGSTIAISLFYANYLKNTLKVSSKFLEIISSQFFLLMTAIVIVFLMLVKSSLGLNESLETIDTEKQWKFIANLISFTLVLLMFLFVTYRGIVSFIKRFTKLV